MTMLLRCPQLADVDGDGSITSIDATLILQIGAGLLIAGQSAAPANRVASREAPPRSSSAAFFSPERSLSAVRHGPASPTYARSIPP